MLKPKQSDPDVASNRQGKPIPAQRKTTLKWQKNGELSAIDMARVVDRLTNPQLNRCELQTEQS